MFDSEHGMKGLAQKRCFEADKAKKAFEKRMNGHVAADPLSKSK